METLPDAHPTPKGWRKLDGVLLIDKPVGPTSQDVVFQLRKLLQIDKAGHGGTLDPLASGLLVVGFGEATKYLHRHLDGDKTYVATVQFGATTTTGDREGEVTETTSSIPAAQLLSEILPSFLGKIEQMPPQYSALKIAGKPAYAYARAGEIAPLQPRTVEIHALNLLNYHNSIATLEIRCSKGTYIRAFASDIAVALGSLAYLRDLRRIASGALTLSDAVSVDEIASTPFPQRAERLVEPARLVRDLPALNVSFPEAEALTFGKPIFRESIADHIYAVFLNHQFLGLVSSRRGEIRVVRLLGRESLPQILRHE